MDRKTAERLVTSALVTAQNHPLAEIEKMPGWQMDWGYGRAGRGVKKLGNIGDKATAFVQASYSYSYSFDLELIVYNSTTRGTADTVAPGSPVTPESIQLQ